MARNSTPQRAAQASVILSALAGSASAARSLQQVAACGQALPAMDIPGANGATFGGTEDLDDCVVKCEGSGANAAIRINSNGGCFCKSVDADTVVPVDGNAFTSFIVCDDTDPVDPVDPVDPDPNPVVNPNAPCGEFIADMDIPGENLGASGNVLSEEACLSICEGTETCTAAIYFPAANSCFYKAVDVTTVIPGDGPFISYLICPDGVPVDPVGPVDPPVDPDAPPPVVNPNAPCDEFIVGFDIPGDNLGSGPGTEQQDCVTGCGNLADCNAAIFFPTGNACFYKSVDVATVVPVAGPFESILFCEGVDAVDPVDPTDPPVDTTPPLDGSLASILAPDGCPVATPPLPTPVHLTKLGVPGNANQGALPNYLPPNPLQELNDDGTIDMPYPLIQNGDIVCQAPGVETIVVGGNLQFSSGGQCQDFPRAPGGGPCCTLYMWQPNENGLYYDDCTMSIQPDVNGVFWWRSYVPGNEAVGGWGPDPEPHYHFDVECNGCAADSAIGAGATQMANKFYVKSLFLAQGATAQSHLAVESELNGEEVHKIQIVMNA